MAAKELFLPGARSTLGRTTEAHLNAMRRQLGVGIDPAYDYTDMMEMQKEFARKLRSPDKKGSQDSAGESDQPSSVAPTGALAELEKALQDVVEGDRRDFPSASKEAGTDGFQTPPIVKERRRIRKSPAFVARSRASLNRCHELYAFNPPPLGTYRPKDHLILPTVREASFTEKKETKSLKTVAVEAEIEALQAQNKPVDHLIKKGVSVEDVPYEEVPQRVRMHVSAPDLQKCLERPDMIKLSKINFQENSFHRGVLDGDLKCSALPRRPEWDFSKAEGKKGLAFASYFQPGQYKMNYDAVREVGGKVGIEFQKQPHRKPIIKPIVHGPSVIPDRSLSRKCAATVPRILQTELEKQTNRPPISKPIPEYHDKKNAKACESIRQREISYDVNQAEQFRTKDPTSFDCQKFLTRDQAIVGTRAYGQDPVLAKGKHVQKIRSVEVLAVDDVFRKHTQTGHGRILTHNFTRMKGREEEQVYTLSPPRKKEFSESSKFIRETREGSGGLSLTSSAPQLRIAKPASVLVAEVSE